MTAEGLFTPAGKTWLEEEYLGKECSPYELADRIGTYARKVRDALLFHHLPVRNMKQAQEVALRKGRRKSPTEGRERTGAEREHISRGMERAWRERRQS